MFIEVSPPRLNAVQLSYEAHLVQSLFNFLGDSAIISVTVAAGVKGMESACPPNALYMILLIAKRLEMYIYETY